MIHTDRKKSIFGWLFSLLLHISLLFLLLYIPYSAKRISSNEKILNVDIVSSVSRTKPKIHRKKPAKKIKKIRTVHRIIKKRRQQKKKPLKKISKTKKRIKKIKVTTKKPAKKVAENNLSKIRERIRKEQKIKKVMLKKRISKIFQKIKTEIRQTSSKKVPYQNLIKLLIKREWKINKYMLKKADYTAIVKVVIAKSGRLILTKLKQRSGDAYYDKTCVDAVRAAAPFPPYKASNDRIIEIILTCNVSKNEFN
ncbi:MAG TPA: TonB C-terminal domain-containing protein [Deltaproteobacteria bacterium]|nr:TonB C-terminal domain-containing protein [Deltaproteobacteria bacterium]